MLRSTASKVMWVGRATVFLVGLAVILALVFGVASMAFGANGQSFLLGKWNAATALTKLTGNVNGSAMQVVNPNTGANDTALSLSVQAGEAPMVVNSAKKVTNLNADRIDDREASSFANGVGGIATNADKLDGKDSSDFAAGEEAPGFDSAVNAGNWGLSDQIDDAASVSITAPADGFVILSGDGRFQLNHSQNSSGIPTHAQVSLSETSKGWVFDNSTGASVGAGYPTGSFHVPFGMTRAFPVTAGEHTFYLTAKSAGVNGSSVLIKDPSLTGFFVKNQL